MDNTTDNDLPTIAAVLYSPRQVKRAWLARRMRNIRALDRGVGYDDSYTPANTRSYCRTVKFILFYERV